MKYFLVCLLCSLQIASFSQTYKYNYYLDKNFNSVMKSDDALFIGKGMYENDLFRLDCYLKNSNDLFAIVHFSDSSLSSYEGSYESFFSDKRKASSGMYRNNLEQGVWQTWDSSGILKDSILYDRGREMIKAFYTYDSLKRVESYEYTDSIADIYSYHYYYHGVIYEWAEFKGNDGTDIIYDSTGEIKNTYTVTSRKMEEAHFPGGNKAFKQYLEQTMNGDVAIRRNAPYGIYTVVIRFVVEKDGTITNVIPETDIGYGMEKEGIRVIKRSPKWVPATQFGRIVRAYRRQPFSFMVSK